jgi:ribonuclease Z
MNDYYDYWKKELDLDKKYKLKGFSRGGLRTGFMLLPDNIFLDAGIPCPIKPSAILITHGHQDHIDSLYNHLLDNDEKVQVIGASTLIHNLTDYLSACRTLNTGYKVKFDKWDPKIISDNLTINVNNTKYYIETVNLDHGVECLGYGLSEVRNKLKSQYIELSGIEIAGLKKNKVEITEEINFPILFFCGDMNYTSLVKLPFNSYPYFIIECTFFDAEHHEEARMKKHLHISDLVTFFNEYPNTKFILIHFSCRYTKSQLKDFEKIYKFDNVIFWI